MSIDALKNMTFDQLHGHMAVLTANHDALREQVASMIVGAAGPASDRLHAAAAHVGQYVALDVETDVRDVDDEHTQPVTAEEIIDAYRRLAVATDDITEAAGYGVSPTITGDGDEQYVLIDGADAARVEQMFLHLAAQDVLLRRALREVAQQFATVRIAATNGGAMPGEVFVEEDETTGGAA